MGLVRLLAVDVAHELPRGGRGPLNTVSTIGSFVLGFSMLPFVYNVYRSYRYGEVTVADDPWGFGNSLEWTTTSPPPRHNFLSIPRIRSKRPAFEHHYPHVVPMLHAEAREHSSLDGGSGRGSAARSAQPDQDE